MSAPFADCFFCGTELPPLDPDRLPDRDRLSFDPKTSTLWAADVGQNIWEEINLIVKGGNYGWNQREGMHKFRASGSGPKPEFIEPIWEYHHDIGRSITGGHVYRGQKIPQLQGWYLYADYIRGEAGSFLRLARYFYGNNKAAPSWWWEAQRLVNASGAHPTSLSAASARTSE